VTHKDDLVDVRIKHRVDAGKNGSLRPPPILRRLGAWTLFLPEPHLRIFSTLRERWRNLTALEPLAGLPPLGMLSELVEEVL
jgi:hypothetical protein